MLDRALHLELGGIAIARYGLLHSLGRKTQHRDSCQPRRQANHPAGMTHQDRRPRVICMAVNFLQAQGLRG